jgi:hypothetical protein
MFKVCAIMAVYNEEDIVFETVSKLINNEIDVYIINNGCTDGTIDKINALVGRGVIKIENLKIEENGKKVFRLERILERVEAITKELNYDWYLHVDADEIRYAPWLGYSLKDGIERVNKEGFNLINFKLFNFRTTETYFYNNSFEESMLYYSDIDAHSDIQIKCWKNNGEINLTNYGGHILSRPNGLLYPIKFIHKHYPVRGVEHGIKKIGKDRRNIFSKFEKEKGWHKHYDEVNFDNLSGILWKKSDLKKYNHENVLLEVHTEANNKLMSLVEILASMNMDDVINYTAKIIHSKYQISQTEARNKIEIAELIVNKNYHENLPVLNASKVDSEIINKYFDIKRIYLNAKAMPLHEKSINRIKFNIV